MKKIFDKKIQIIAFTFALVLGLSTFQAVMPVFTVYAAEGGKGESSGDGKIEMPDTSASPSPSPTASVDAGGKGDNDNRDDEKNDGRYTYEFIWAPYLNDTQRQAVSSHIESEKEVYFLSYIYAYSYSSGARYTWVVYAISLSEFDASSQVYYPLTGLYDDTNVYSQNLSTKVVDGATLYYTNLAVSNGSRYFISGSSSSLSLGSSQLDSISEYFDSSYGMPNCTIYNGLAGDALPPSILNDAMLDILKYESGITKDIPWLFPDSPGKGNNPNDDKNIGGTWPDDDNTGFFEKLYNFIVDLRDALWGNVGSGNSWFSNVLNILGATPLTIVTSFADSFIGQKIIAGMDAITWIPQKIAESFFETEAGQSIWNFTRNFSPLSVADAIQSGTFLEYIKGMSSQLFDIPGLIVKGFSESTVGQFIFDIPQGIINGFMGGEFGRIFTNMASDIVNGFMNGDFGDILRGISFGIVGNEPQDIKSILIELFQPDPERIFAYMDDIRSSVPLIDSSLYVMNSIQDHLENVGDSPPKFVIPLSDTSFGKYGVDDFTLTFEWFAPYRSLVLDIESAFLWAAFALRIFYSIKSIFTTAGNAVTATGDVARGVKIYDI